MRRPEKNVICLCRLIKNVYFCTLLENSITLLSYDQQSSYSS